MGGMEQGGKGWADALVYQPPWDPAPARPPCEGDVLTLVEEPRPVGTCLNAVVATPPPTQPLSHPEPEGLSHRLSGLEGPRVTCSSGQGNGAGELGKASQSHDIRKSHRCFSIAPAQLTV